MKESIPPANDKDLIFLTTLLAVGLVCFELWMATTHHPNNRDQHLGGAVAYAQSHINLLRPMLLGFNANGAPTPLEFPLWQAITAVLMKGFGLWYGWGNVVALTFFFSSLWVLFDLCRRLCSVRTGWWAMIFSLAQPLSFMIGGQAGGDSTAWALAMWFIYSSYRMMSEGKLIWWFLAIFTGSLSAVTKAPFFMTAGLTAFFWLLLQPRKSGRAWFFLISSGAISIVFFLVWNLHCHRVYTEADFPTINLDPFDEKGGIIKWYFGTSAYRLNLHNFFRGGWHLLTMVFGNLGFIFLVLLATRLKKTAHAWLGLLAAAGTTAVFTELLWEHIHYFFIFAPVIAWLCAIAAAELELPIWQRLQAATSVRIAILSVTLITSLAGAFMIIHLNQLFDPYQEEIAQLIKQHTAPSDKIVVWGMIWGDPFLRADRQGLTGGLSLIENEWINNTDNLQRLKKLGYKKIVLINPSPFIVALTSVVGNHGEKIADLHQCLPAVARNWLVVFDSAQMLIVQIPD